MHLPYIHTYFPSFFHWCYWNPSFPPSLSRSKAIPTIFTPALSRACCVPYFPPRSAPAAAHTTLSFPPIALAARFFHLRHADAGDSLDFARLHWWGAIPLSGKGSPYSVGKKKSSITRWARARPGAPPLPIRCMPVLPVCVSGYRRPILRRTIFCLLNAGDVQCVRAPNTHRCRKSCCEYWQ